MYQVVRDGGRVTRFAVYMRNRPSTRNPQAMRIARSGHARPGTMNARIKCVVSISAAKIGKKH
jgi:hypothetical protein